VGGFSAIAVGANQFVDRRGHGGCFVDGRDFEARSGVQVAVFEGEPVTCWLSWQLGV
jgi:hypothetical protein